MTLTPSEWQELFDAAAASARSAGASEHNAADIAQRAIVVYLQAVKEQPIASPRGFVSQKARWLALDEIRAPANVSVPDALDTPGSTPASEGTDAAARQELTALVRTLPPAWQRLLYARFSQGKTLAEIAKAESLSLAAVYRELQSAILYLRATLEAGTSDRH